MDKVITLEEELLSKVNEAFEYNFPVGIKYQRLVDLLSFVVENAVK